MWYMRSAASPRKRGLLSSFASMTSSTASSPTFWAILLIPRENKWLVYEPSIGCPTVVDDFLQVEQEFTRCHELGIVGFIETGIATGMADRTGWNRLYKQGIVVAVGDNLTDRKIISTRLPFRPQFLSGTRIKSHQATFLCNGQSLLIHIPKHEDTTCHRILYDCRYQSITFVKIHLHQNSLQPNGSGV